MIKFSYLSGLFTTAEEMEKDYYKVINSTNFSIAKMQEEFDIRVKKELPIKTVFCILTKCDYAFKIIFAGLTLKEILLMNPTLIPTFIFHIERRMIVHLNNSQKDIFINRLKKLFDYKDKYQGTKITPFFKNNFDFRVCYYCNRAYTTNFISDNEEKKSTFQLDHFYEKIHYPYLALSLYNFIPCCATCNSTVKNSAINSKDDDCYAQKCIAPNREDFDFDNSVRFSSFYNNEEVSIDKPDDIKHNLIEMSGEEKYKNYIDLFKLDERYESHKNLAFDLIKTRDILPDTRISEISHLLSLSEDEVKMHFFGKYLYDDIANDTLSKYLKDLGRELGLVE